jgi:hypothetical protein
MDAFIESLANWCYADLVRDLASEIADCRRPATKEDALSILDKALRSGDRKQIVATVVDAMPAKDLRPWAKELGYSTSSKGDAVAALVQHYGSGTTLAKIADAATSFLRADARPSADAPTHSAPSGPPAVDVSRLSPPERSVILVSSRSGGIRALWSAVGNFTNTRREQAKITLPEAHGLFEFDAGHPKEDRYYVLNYYDSRARHYFVAEEAVERLLRTKLSMVQRLAISLGATRIEFRQSETREGSYGGNVSLDYVVGQLGASAHRTRVDGNTYAVSVELGAR